MLFKKKKEKTFFINYRLQIIDKKDTKKYTGFSAKIE